MTILFPNPALSLQQLEQDMANTKSLLYDPSLPTLYKEHLIAQALNNLRYLEGANVAVTEEEMRLALEYQEIADLEELVSNQFRVIVYQQEDAFTALATSSDDSVVGARS